jgi:hypothetical protein
MSRTLTISEGLYARLEAAAQRLGLQDVVQLLETWETDGEELARRAKVVQDIDSLREKILKTCGPMPDSVDLMREDRER